MKQCMDSADLHLRLKKVAGQINAVDKMIDEDVPCADIIIQINAAKSALQKVGQIITEGHLNHCVRDMMEHGDVDRTLEEFSRVLAQYSKLRYPRGVLYTGTPVGYPGEADV